MNLLLTEQQQQVLENYARERRETVNELVRAALVAFIPSFPDDMPGRGTYDRTAMIGDRSMFIETHPEAELASKIADEAGYAFKPDEFYKRYLTATLGPWANDSGIRELEATIVRALRSRRSEAQARQRLGQRDRVDEELSALQTRHADLYPDAWRAKVVEAASARGVPDAYADRAARDFAVGSNVVATAQLIELQYRAERQ